MIVELLVTSLVTGLTAFIYFLFFWKLKISNDLTDIGSSTSKQKFKKNADYGKMPPVYPNGWFGLLESSALKKGEVKHVAMLGQNFAVFRTKTGKARILNAYCPHLGANLAEGGIVKDDDDIECPFHAWRFCGKTGKCTHIPYTKNVLPTFKTKAWECIEANGFIFVWYHAESAPPDWYPQQIKQISNGTWKYQGKQEYYLESHIQDIMENTADPTHFNAVHDFNRNFISKLVNHSWISIKWSAHTENDPSVLSRLSGLQEITDIFKYDLGEKHKTLTILDSKISVFGINFAGNNALMLIDNVGPGYVKIILKTFMGYLGVVHSVTPITPRLQKLTHLVYAPTMLAPIAKILFFVDYLTIYGDALVWKYKKYIDNPMLTKEDQAIKSFRKWYSQFYSENSPTYESCKNNTMEW